MVFHSSLLRCTEIYAAFLKNSNTLHKELFTLQPSICFFTGASIFYYKERNNIMSEGILEISDSSFDSEVIQSEKPVLVDFWAPWCGPCKAIGPIIEELAGEFGDKIKFAKCNVDDSPVSPGKFGIKAIPTLIFFKQGKVVEQITGMVAKSKLQQTINGIL